MWIMLILCLDSNLSPVNIDTEDVAVDSSLLKCPLKIQYSDTPQEHAISNRGITCLLSILAHYEIRNLFALCSLNRSTRRFIRWNIYSFQISILLAFSQNRIDQILNFTWFVFSWHFIRIKPNMKYVSNSINNHRFQMEMTLRHRNINEMQFFIEDLYNKTQKVAFLFYTEK